MPFMSFKREKPSYLITSSEDSHLQHLHLGRAEANVNSGDQAGQNVIVNGAPLHFHYPLFLAECLIKLYFP